MNNLLQLICNSNWRIGAWVLRIALVIIILVAAQAIISVVAMFVSGAVQELSNFFRESINSISHGFTSGNRVETLVKLCLWLVTIIIILRILFTRNTP